MSDYGKLVSSWEISLKSTREKAAKCLPKILKEIKSAEGSLKGKIAYKMIVFLCQNFNNASDLYDTYTELFRALVPFIADELWDGFSQYFNYFLSSLVNKKQWSEAISLLPLLEIKKTQSEKVIRAYFDIYSKPVALLISKEKYKGDLKETYFKRITKVLHIAFTTAQPLFLDLVMEIFETNNYLRQNIEKYFSDAKEFLEDYIATLRCVKNMKDFDTFYTKSTTILRTILIIEFEQSTNLAITLSYIKSCMAVEKIESNKYCCHILSLFYYFIKLYNCRSDENFNANLTEVFNKFMNILDLEKKNEVWFMDTLVILTEIISLFSSDMREIMNEENLIIAFNILFKLTKALPDIQYNKTFCSYCVNLKRHEIVSVAQSAVNLYRSVIKMDIKEKSVGNAMVTIMNYLSKIYDSFNCKNAEILINNIYLGCFKCINLVENEFQAAYAIHLLKILDKFKINSEQTSPGAAFYLYKKMYFHLKDYKSCIEMYCLYIAHHLSKPNYNKNVINDILLCSKMYENAGFDYGLSLCDILEQKQIEYEIPSYDKKLLLRLHLDVALKYYPTEKSKQSLVIRVLEKIDSDVEFALIVQKLGAITVPNLLQRVEKSISKLESREKNSTKSDIYLALGCLYKRLYIFKFESAKKSFGEKSFSENSLHNMDYTEFKNVAISIENGAIEAGVKSIHYFSKFYENKQSCTVSFSPADIIDCISYLARHFKLRGYLDHAYKAWKLAYTIACEADCTLSKIRAISFFTEVVQIYKYFKIDINVNELIEMNTAKIIKSFEEIDSLTPRQQNYVLICILNIARYHASECDFETSNALMRSVQIKLKEMESRKDSFELVSATLHAVMFTINIKSGGIFMSPYRYAYYIMEQLKNIKYITSEDTVNIPTLLFDAVSDIAQFLINRLGASAVKPYLYMMLKFATSFGLTFRITQILFFLAHIDLQMEMSTECETKLCIMDIMLEDVKFSMKTDSNAKTSKALVPHTASTLFPTLDMVEPIRKAVPSISVSPKNFKSPVMDSEDRLNRYLASHDSTCTCNICKNPVFQMVSFQIGVMRARYYYIVQDFATAKIFFKKALLWWNKLDNIYLKLLFRDISFWMLMYYINSLRRAKDYDNALQICDISLKYYEKYEPILDVAHIQNAVEQKISVEYIKEKQKTARKCNDTTAKELQSAKKSLRFSPLNIVQENNVIIKEDLDLKLPKLEENNNEKIKEFSEEEVILIPASPEEIKISKTGRRRKLQNCENPSNKVNSSKEPLNVQTPTSIFDKKENNQRKRITAKKREKTSTETKQEEPKDETIKITRARRKRM